MLIKMLAKISTSRGLTAQGKVYDLPEVEALAQIKAGNAEAVDGEQATQPHPTPPRADEPLVDLDGGDDDEGDDAEE